MKPKTQRNKWTPLKCATMIGLAGAMLTGLTSVSFADKDAGKAKSEPLTGAQLYAINCNRCHAERYPTEWKSAQWKTIMLHMRVRANLPASQARKILKYLQENSGN